LKLGNKIEVETCILPLIENSIYNQVRELVGGAPVQLNSSVLTERTIVSVAAKLDLKNNDMAKQLDMFQAAAFPTLPRLSDCLGSNLSINFYDSDVLFTFSEQQMQSFGGRMNIGEQVTIGMIASSINLPIYLSVEVLDEANTKTLLRESLKIASLKSAVQSGRNDFGIHVEPYSSGEYNGVEVNSLLCRFFLIKFRLHYAIKDGRLIIATKRYVLDDVIDTLVANHLNKTEDKEGNVLVNVQPNAFDRILPVVKTGWQERMRKACLNNIVSVKALVENHNAAPDSISSVSKKVDGVTLRCPSRGKYNYDKERKIVYCGVHGNNQFPRQDSDLPDHEGLLEFLGNLDNFSLGFKFTEEGIMTKITLDQEDEKR